MIAERVSEILGGFSGKRVLVVGDVFIDRYVYGNVERLNPEAPVPILAAKETEEMTGGAGNVAKNLAALGAEAVLVGVVGEDDQAKRLGEQAEREGYVAALVADDGRSTIQKVRYLVKNQQLFRADFEETNDISGEVEARVVAEIERLGTEVEAILVSDYAKGIITEAVAGAIMKVGEERAILVAVDAKPSRMHLFAGASFISPNRKEAHEILGWNEHERGGKASAELAQALREKLQTDVFLTLSADGVYVLTQEGVEQHVPQEHVVEVFDPSGAGDTAIATLLLAKLTGAEPVEMAELANAAGAVVVQKVGSVGVSPAEVEAMLTHQHEAGFDHGSE